MIALVRARRCRGARRGSTECWTNLFGRGAGRYRDRVEAVAADMTAPDLGLSPAQRERLAQRVTTIVHSAASVSFSMGLQESREINVAGTRRMLELARLAQERGGLRCYGHISTAYVAGTHAGGFAECDLDVGQGFHNAYEQSKFEAEQLVRDGGVPFTILRPSSSSATARTAGRRRSTSSYWPLRAFARGLFTAVPAIPTAPVDVVSIDYVADATYALVESGRGVGHTYHLTAGAQASTMGRSPASRAVTFASPLPRVLPPGRVRGAAAPGRRGPGAGRGQRLLPVLLLRHDVSGRVTRARLVPHGIAASPLCDYMERLLDFATRSRWGKSPIARVDAFACVVAVLSGVAGADTVLGIQAILRGGRETDLAAGCGHVGAAGVHAGCRGGASEAAGDVGGGGDRDRAGSGDVRLGAGALRWLQGPALLGGCAAVDQRDHRRLGHGGAAHGRSTDGAGRGRRGRSKLLANDPKLGVRLSFKAWYRPR